MFAFESSWNAISGIEEHHILKADLKASSRTLRSYFNSSSENLSFEGVKMFGMISMKGNIGFSRKLMRMRPFAGTSIPSRTEEMTRQSSWRFINRDRFPNMSQTSTMMPLSQST